MATFETLIQNLQEIQFFTYFMPFIFLLAVTYGIISKIDIFDDDDVVEASVSLAVAFMGMLGIYLLNLGDVMVYFFGAVSVGLVTVLGFVLVAGMFGVDISQMGQDSKKKFAGIAGAVVVGILIILVNEFLDVDFYGYLTSEFAYTVLMLGGIIVFMYILVRSGNN